jgi:hypothetical protein
MYMPSSCILQEKSASKEALCLLHFRAIIEKTPLWQAALSAAIGSPALSEVDARKQGDCRGKGFGC